KPRTLPGIRNLGQEVILRIVAVVALDPPGDRAVRNVVAHAEVHPAALDAADLTIKTGQRVFHARLFEAGVHIELSALPAHRVEVDRARALEAPAGGTRQIADAFAVVLKGDDVDDVADDVI